MKFTVVYATSRAPTTSDIYLKQVPHQSERYRAWESDPVATAFFGHVTSSKVE